MVSLQDLEDQGLLTWEQAEELAAWFRSAEFVKLPPDLHQVMSNAWHLATMDEEATVH